MAKTKHGKPDEHYLGEIRNLRSENRNLKKRLKALERKLYNTSKVKDEEEIYEEPVEQIQLTRCPKCDKGHLNEVTVVGRVFSKCDSCDFRTKAEKI